MRLRTSISRCVCICTDQFKNIHKCAHDILLHGAWFHLACILPQGSTPEEVAAAAAAAAAVRATGGVDGVAGGHLSDEHAACVEQIKAVSESIKELRRSLPPSHHLHLASEKGTASASSGTRRASANKEGKESCDDGVGTAFSSKVTTLDIGDCEDGWNDFW